MGQSISIGALLPLPWRLWLGRRLFGSVGSGVIRVSWHRVIKGPVRPPEVEAMQYVQSHTNVPIPRLYAVHTEPREGLIYIEMAYVRGEPLGYGLMGPEWQAMSDTEKDGLMDEIGRHISTLRALPPPPTTEPTVGSALLNPGFDCRVGYNFWGPFSLDSFHKLLRHGMPDHMVAEVLGEDAAYTHTERKYRVCFSHADLAPRNLLVHKGRLSAIIDWEFGGWYPEYWEFTRANYMYVSDEWDERLRKLLPGYDRELEAERFLWRCASEPATCSIHTFADGRKLKNSGSLPSPEWLQARESQSPPPDDLWTIALQRLARRRPAFSS